MRRRSRPWVSLLAACVHPPWDLFRAPGWSRRSRAGAGRGSRVCVQAWVGAPVSPGRPLRFGYPCFAPRAAHGRFAALPVFGTSGRAAGPSGLHRGSRGAVLLADPPRIAGISLFRPQGRAQAFCRPSGVLGRSGAVRGLQVCTEGAQGVRFLWGSPLPMAPRRSFLDTSWAPPGISLFCSQTPPTSWPGSSTPCCAMARSTWMPARNTTNVLRTTVSAAGVARGQAPGGTTGLPTGANVRRRGPHHVRTCRRANRRANRRVKTLVGGELKMGESSKMELPHPKVAASSAGTLRRCVNHIAEGGRRERVPRDEGSGPAWGGGMPRYFQHGGAAGAAGFRCFQMVSWPAFRACLPARRRAWPALPRGRFRRCCRGAAGWPSGPSG